MEQELRIEEQFSPVWKTTAVSSAVLAILFFIIFLITDDPLWKGIFRLAAFIAFIGVVFCVLRLREGRKELRLELSEEQLVVTYFHKSEMIKEELFERKTINEVYKKEHKLPGRLPFFNKGYEYFITFTDTETELPMFEYSGRNLHFSEETAGEIDNFIEKYIHNNPRNP